MPVVSSYVDVYNNSIRPNYDDDGIAWDPASTLRRHDADVTTGTTFDDITLPRGLAERSADGVIIDVDDQIQSPLAGCVIAVVVLGCASVVAAVLYAYLYYFRLKPGHRSAELARRSAAAGQGTRWSVVHGTGYGHHVIDHVISTSSSSTAAVGAHHGHHGGGGGAGAGHWYGASRGRATHLLIFKKT